jgi:hypothetical protein
MSGATWRAAWLIICAAGLGACAGQRDHFYALSTLPRAAQPRTGGFTTQVMLEVSIPDVVDRPEMIIHAGGDRVLVLEHERWVAPLSDLVRQTLARDIERRRANALVAGRGFDQADAQAVHMNVDLVRMSVEQGGPATVEAHWRIIDPRTKTDLIGGEIFTAPIEGGDYDSTAKAFSTCLAALADRLVDELPAH